MFTKHKSIFAESFNYGPLWGTRYSINLGQLAVDWIDYLIIRKLGYYCHNSLLINNILHYRKRQCKHDEDLITWPAHSHTVYLIRSGVHRKKGREQSGYQFHDIKKPFHRQPWVVRCYYRATWLDAINHDWTLYHCSRACLQLLCKDKAHSPFIGK